MALHEYSLDGSGWEIYGYHADQWQAFPADPQQLAGQRAAKDVGPFSATVPGAVQADLLAAGAIPNPYWEEQSRLSEWVSARHWEYSNEFIPPDTMRGKRIFLVFEGIDPGGVIYLNGERITEHDGQFLPLEIDVTDRVRFDTSNLLQVFLREAPPCPNQCGHAKGETKIHTRFTAKWDFGTRYQPVGIWKSVRLIAVGTHRLLDAWVRPRLHLPGHNANVIVQVTIQPEGKRHFEVRTTIFLGDTPVSAEQTPHLIGKSPQVIAHEHFLADPQLWWPNGYGRPTCYRLRVELLDAAGEMCDQREVSFGIRDLRYVRNDGAPAAAHPYTLLVNGTPIFLKGWTVAPVDHLYGQQNAGKVRRLLRLARDAGANCVRVWGGGVLESEQFYTRCDELGLLVWQDFPQSPATPSADAQDLARWEELAPVVIRSRRNHPSLAIWCGGDALTDQDGTPAAVKEPVLKLLQRIVQEEDPDRLFLPTSSFGPTGIVSVEQPREQHDTQGPWRYLGPTEHYASLNALGTMLHSACGCPGAATYDAMRLIAREEKLWPPTNANPLWVHRGLWWIDYPLLLDLFGSLPALEDYLQASHLLQAEGIRYLIEANRRRKWRCSGVLLWQLNEPWPNLACTNVIDYFGQPKPAYYYAANAFRAETISARYDRIAWQPGETFTARVFVSNSLERARPLKQCWTLFDCSGNVLAQESRETLSHPNSVLDAGQIAWPIPENFAEPFMLRLTLRSAEEVVHQNDYLFSSAPAPIFRLLNRLRPAQLAVRAREADGHVDIAITNTGRTLALGVSVTRPDGHWLYGADNYRHLLPGETWTPRFTSATREGFYMALDTRPEQNQIAISAWNTHPQQLYCSNLIPR